MDDLPYLAEYAKSGRAGCKLCKSPIAQGSLRLAAMVQSPFHDGKNPNWFHSHCFFVKQRPQALGDIAKFNTLKYEDQQMIKKKMEEVAGSVVPTKGKKRGKGKSDDNLALKDFGVEYAKSNRSECRGCQQKISTGDIRIRKTVYDTEVGMKYGGQPLWHHVECFVQVRNELGYFAGGDMLPGLNTLSKDDQKEVKKKVPAVKQADIPEAKKIKLEKKESEEEDKEQEIIRKQNEAFYKYKEKLEVELNKNELISILEKNHQNVPPGKERILNAVAEMLTFGTLKCCPECSGQLKFENSGYKCTGNSTEWSKCEYTTTDPSRVKTVIPKDLAQEHSFLAKYKCKIQKRVFSFLAKSAAALKVKKEEDAMDGPKVQRELPPLYQMEFVIIGKLKRSKEQVKSILMKAGGKLGTKLHDKLAAVISTKDEVEVMNTRMETVQTLNIQVVGEEFLDEFTKIDPIKFIQTQNICDWGSDPKTRIQQQRESNKSKSIYEKSVPKSMTLKLKGGSAVDPESGLEDTAHVFEQKGTKFNVVLAKTDIQRDKNSFYKMQLLQSDKGEKFWLFRSWGRIGTTIGDKRVDKFSTLYDAMEQFEHHYLEKTGNDWMNRDLFVKQANMYYPLDIDYGGDDEKVKSLSEHCDIKSKLDTKVQNLIKLIFDINAMKKVMMEFELDMEKMPLGKLSQKQIKSAYSVLTELSTLIQNGGTNAQFIAASNRFYTLIPHSFGVSMPPILDTVEIVQSKIDMLESLLEIEVAYNLLSTSDDDKQNPIDMHYDQLKAEVVPLDKSDPEFAILEKYVQNTHASTHNMYDLIIEDIFKVNRNGETKRYKPFKKLHNRRLLWHGSRLTNYVGILSHGLKIAPPEAPSTGYMFGKGIYFADMVSKSANYCCTSSGNSTGLMLLCEVALGNMKECTQAEYVTKLPKDKHSTIGMGKTQPDPKEFHTREDGVLIPYGKPTTNTDLKSSLLYNEFIVYDAAQVNVQYLFKMNFKYKY